MIRLQTVIVIGRSNCSGGRCVEYNVVCIGHNIFTGILEGSHFDEGRRLVGVVDVSDKLRFGVFRFNVGIDNGGGSLLNMELAIYKRSAGENVLNGCAQGRVWLEEIRIFI